MNQLVVKYEKQEITRNLLKALRKKSHFTLVVSTKYVMPSCADKDVYHFYDISSLDQFRHALSVGDLIVYKKFAFHCISLFFLMISERLSEYENNY